MPRNAYHDSRFRCGRASGPLAPFNWATDEADARWWLTASSLALADGAPISTWVDQVPVSVGKPVLCSYGGGSDDPVYSATGANGYPCALSAACLLPQSAGDLGSIIGQVAPGDPYPTQDFTLYFIVRVNSVVSTALSRTSQAIWADASQRIGLHTRVSAGTNWLFASFLNATGAFVYSHEIDIGAALPTDWLVVTIRYESAFAPIPFRLFLSVNGVETVARATTSELNTVAGIPQIGASFTGTQADFDLAQCGSKLNSVFPAAAVAAYMAQYI